MKLQENAYLPGDLPGLVRQLNVVYRNITQQVNGLSEGSVHAVYNAVSAPPTTGTYAQGDVLRNATPTEAGTGGSKYVVTQWICTDGGTPGTWRECRALTGN